MKRGLSVTQVVVLWFFMTLFSAGQQTAWRGNVVGEGNLVVHGTISATGDITTNKSVIAAASVSGDTASATAIFRARQCAVVDHTFLVGDSARVIKGMYLGGQFITKVLSGSSTLDFDLTAITEQDKQLTLNGVNLGDTVFLGVPNGSVTATIGYSAWVLSSNTINVRAKTRVAGENPASGTFKVVVFQ